MILNESKIEQGAEGYGVGAYGHTPLRGINIHHELSQL